MAHVKFVDGKLNNAGASLEEYRTGFLFPRAIRVGVVVPDTNHFSNQAPVQCRINHNRLIADCPDCNGAELVWLDGPYVMMCSSCWNAKLGGLWRRVILPKNIDKIIETLLLRPMPHNRNWHPNETLDDLLKENSLHRDELI